MPRSVSKRTANCRAVCLLFLRLYLMPCSYVYRRRADLVLLFRSLFQMKAILLFALLIGTAAVVSAQAVPDRSDTQSWNDVQLTVPLSKKVDLVTKLTL